MKRIYPFIFFLALIGLGGCRSAEYFYKNGRYDEAITRGVKKLHKKPDHQKSIDLVYNSYNIANKIDDARVESLLNQNRPENWQTIYQMYKLMEKRQQLVQRLPPLKPSRPGNDYNFQIRDYAELIENARIKTVTYFENQGDLWAAKGDKLSYREAYTAYRNALVYEPSNINIQSKSEDALARGYSYIQMEVLPVADFTLPPTIGDYLLAINPEQFHSGWLKFLPWNSSHLPDYKILLSIDAVMMSPERLRESEVIEKKTIQDGYIYEYNQDGSIRKDSTGKPIKIPVMKDVSVRVVKYMLAKECNISGYIRLVDASGKTIRVENVFGTYNFSYTYGVAYGDVRALSNASEVLLKNKPMPFPTNLDMINFTMPGYRNSMEYFVRQMRSSII